MTFHLLFRCQQIYFRFLSRLNCIKAVSDDVFQRKDSLFHFDFLPLQTRPQTAAEEGVCRIAVQV